MNVSYNVTVGKVVKRLLKDINLRINGGDMCAVMGPSGAGKRLVHIFPSNIFFFNSIIKINMSTFSFYCLLCID